jgi:hypothetical protein
VERDRSHTYVANLEQIMKNTHSDLREALNQFQELCHRVAPERVIPMRIISDIRQTYKEIQDQLTKIKGVHQLLEGKYRKYYRRDSQRDKEILEFGFLAKNLFSKCESTLREIEAAKSTEVAGQTILFPWFHSEENQLILLRNLKNLNDLDYETRSDLECVQRRKVIWNGVRSISLFILSGGVTWMDQFQSRMRLREYDIKERTTKDELRGALTHLREISHSEVERVIRRFTGGGESTKLRCLILPVQSQKDLGKELLGKAENILHGMGEGEVRTLSI